MWYKKFKKKYQKINKTMTKSRRPESGRDKSKVSNKTEAPALVPAPPINLGAFEPWRRKGPFFAPEAALVQQFQLLSAACTPKAKAWIPKYANFVAGWGGWVIHTSNGIRLHRRTTPSTRKISRLVWIYLAS